MDGLVIVFKFNILLENIWLKCFIIKPIINVLRPLAMFPKLLRSLSISAFIHFQYDVSIVHFVISRCLQSLKIQVLQILQFKTKWLKLFSLFTLIFKILSLKLRFVKMLGSARNKLHLSLLRLLLPIVLHIIGHDILLHHYPQVLIDQMQRLMLIRVVLHHKVHWVQVPKLVNLLCVVLLIKVSVVHIYGFLDARDVGLLPVSHV